MRNIDKHLYHRYTTALLGAHPKGEIKMINSLNKGQQAVLDYCDQALNIVAKAGLETGPAMESQLLDLKAQAVERELIVPVIGIFSAGKSFLLNSILGSKILPEDPDPETALATELHFGVEEHIEVFKNGSATRLGLDEIEKLRKNTGSYDYAKLFLNTPVLRDIEPFVLVDMPGFDSPLDKHNKAIQVYLERGCHYLVLSSVEEGTPTQTLLTQLRALKELGRSFTFFLSKTNLRSAETVSQLKEHYEKTLKRALYADYPVLAVGDVSAMDVVKTLKGINADALFFGLFKNSLQQFCNETLNQINVRITASTKTDADNKVVIEGLKNSISQLESQAQKIATDVANRYSGPVMRNIISEVGQALESSTEDFVNCAVSGGNLTNRINNFLNTTLLLTIKKNTGGLVGKITGDFSMELSAIDNVMKDLNFDESYVQNIVNDVQSVFNNLTIVQSKMSEPSDPKFKNIYFAITSVLAITTTVVAPIVEVLIVFLPVILEPLIKSFREKKQKEELRKQLLTVVFPDIKAKLQGELLPVFEEQARSIINETRASFEARMLQDKEAIERSIEEKNADAEKLQLEISALVAVRDNLRGIMSAILKE
jgi:hypothetical protein